MFFFVALHVSVRESLAISRHFTVNTHAEGKHDILDRAVKLHYFETGSNAVLLNPGEHTASSWLRDRKAGI